MKFWPDSLPSLQPWNEEKAAMINKIKQLGPTSGNSSSTWILLRRTMPKAAAIFAYATGSVIAFLLFSFILGGAFGAFFTGCRLLSLK